MILTADICINRGGIMAKKANQRKLNKLHYSYRYIMSFCYYIMVVIGARGIGKTYGAKKYCIKKFLREGKKFIWLRDTEDTVKRMCSENMFFSDIVDFEGHEGHLEGNKIIIDDKLAGHILPVSTFYKYKGNPYQDIETIVFDEFIAENGQVIRGDRALAFLNTIQTIGRLRTNFKIFLLANALNRGDPILDLLGIKLKGFGYYRNPEKKVIVHYADNDPAFNEATAKSISGILVKGTQYEANLHNNSFNDDEDMYFDNKPPRSKLWYILETPEMCIRLYNAPDGKTYCCKDLNNAAYMDCRYVTHYSMVNTRNKLWTKLGRDTLTNRYEKKRLVFENANVKNQILNAITMWKNNK